MAAVDQTPELVGFLLAGFRGLGIGDDAVQQIDAGFRFFGEFMELPIPLRRFAEADDLNFRRFGQQEIINEIPQIAEFSETPSR